MTATAQLQSLIDAAWDVRAELSPKQHPADLKSAVEEIIEQLDAGTLRVASKESGSWVVHQWVKKAVLLSFRLRDN
ncbi:MAG: hypothetical protein RJA77_675, partial [Pseudomonadota bacterium]